MKQENVMDEFKDFSGLYTPEMVAEKLSVTTQSIRKWLRTKQLRGVKIGRLWRIRPEDFADFIDPVSRVLESAPLVDEAFSASDVRAIKKAEQDILHNRGRTMEQLKRDLGL